MDGLRGGPVMISIVGTGRASVLQNTQERPQDFV